jgi:hypothetical protein
MLDLSVRSEKFSYEGLIFYRIGENESIDF